MMPFRTTNFCIYPTRMQNEQNIPCKKNWKWAEVVCQKWKMRNCNCEDNWKKRQNMHYSRPTVSVNIFPFTNFHCHHCCILTCSFNTHDPDVCLMLNKLLKETRTSFLCQILMQVEQVLQMSKFLVQVNLYKLLRHVLGVQYYDIKILHKIHNSSAKR